MEEISSKQKKNSSVRFIFFLQTQTVERDGGLREKDQEKEELELELERAEDRY